MSYATRADRTGRRSILSTVTILMVIAMSLLFAGFAAFHVVSTSKLQRQDHERYMATTSHFIRAELEGTLEPGGSEQEELDEIEAVVLRENASRRSGRLLVFVTDPAGRPLLATRGATELMAEQPPFPPAAGSAGRTRISYWESRRGKHYVLSSLDTNSADGRNRRVSVALDWSEAEDKVEAYRRQSVAGALVFTLLAAVASALVTRHSLRPLAVIRDAADSIGQGSFDARLDPSLLPSELIGLAQSFERMQEHLGDAFERLSQFAADLAHELRTPVSNLMGETEVALSRPRSIDEYTEVLGSNLEELVRLSRIIDSLLFLANASRGAARLETEALDLGVEVDSLIEYHRPVAEELEVALERVGEGSLAADRTLFRRAVSNLLSNALQASNRGGVVSVSISRTASTLTVAVSDQGIGILDADIPLVFERFHRCEEARARRPDGSGLGLAIVKSIVELHGGVVSIKSLRGEGTIVSLSFPTPA